MNYQDNSIRLNKCLSEAGICSRRQADQYIEAGRVTVNGSLAKIGMKVLPSDIVCVDGVSIKKEKEILLAFYKPKGIICTTDQTEPNNIIDFIQYERRVYPIGRLDKDSEGLILLTNQGEIVDKILRGSNEHEKEYIVTVNKKITESFLEGMRNGVVIQIEDKNHISKKVKTRPCIVNQIDETKFQIILTQGFNRQIRKMCEYFQFRVLHLKRVRIMNITLGRLHCGTLRKVTTKEKQELYEKIGYKEI